MDFKQKKKAFTSALKFGTHNTVEQSTEPERIISSVGTQLPLLNPLKNQMNHNRIIREDFIQNNNKMLEQRKASLFDVPKTQQLASLESSPNIHSKIQKELKLRDFENFEKISLFELDSIELHYLKKLYMIYPKNTSSILYRIQKKQNSDFDGTQYTKTMIELFRDCYQLPNFIKRYDDDNKAKYYSKEPYDDLFVWSLLLYGGNEKDLQLIRHFWSKTKYPIACCLIGMITFNSLTHKNFIPDDLKEKMSHVIKEFETMACEIVLKCYSSNQLVTQDLLICELDVFYKQTVLKLAIKANAYEFVGLVPVQQLFTDVWFDKIDPHVSNWQIVLPYLFFPSLFFNISYFRSDIIELANLTELDEKSTSKTNLRNEKKEKLNLSGNAHSSSHLPIIPNTELSFRCTKHKLTGLQRLYSFHNSPVIKFINHFIAYVLFLILFSFFLLFDYYPEIKTSSTVIIIPIGKSPEMIKMTITELILIICVAIYHMGELREFIKQKTCDEKYLTKIKNFYMEDKWNIFDFFLFLVFYLALIIRLLPIFGHVYYISNESCYDIARLFYCLDLIMWYVKIIQAICCLPFWGPKIIIIQIKKLVVFVVLILIFLIPFGTSVESIIHKTQKPSIATFFKAMNRAFWTIFGELLGTLNEFEHYQCSKNGTSIDCEHSISGVFLYVEFAFYTITCNLLILNMIIATFASTVEEINIDSNKFYKFQRYFGIKEYSDSSMIPAPFVIFEYIVNVFNYVRNCINGETYAFQESFKIEDADEETRRMYIIFENNHRDKYYVETYVNLDKKINSQIEKINNSIVRLEENLNLFKIWSVEQQNERYLSVRVALENLTNVIERKITFIDK